MALKRDLIYVGGLYENSLPKEKKYLLKYFKTRIQDMFLRYYHAFGNFDNFTDHTGFMCQKRWLISLHQKLIRIEAAHKEAKTNLDSAKVAEIESGKFKFRKDSSE